MKQWNRKSPPVFHIGVLLLCAILITTHGMSGLYARYISTSSAQSTATVAKFDVEMAGSSHIYSNVKININTSAVYTLVDTFRVVNTGQVTFHYDLNLRLSHEASGTYDAPTPVSFTSLAAPALGGASLHLIRNLPSSTQAEIVGLDFPTFTDGKSYTAGKIYYAVSTDGENFTWYEASSADGLGTLNVTGTLAPNAVCYYKVLHFVDLSTEDDGFSMQPTSLLYSIQCTQKD